MRRSRELWGLERRDVDLDERVLRVERVWTQGVLKEPAKSSCQRRRVPLRGRVVDALRSLPPRLDTPLLFPAPRGGHIDGEKFRYREWSRRCAPPASSTGARMTAATRSRPGRCTATCRCSTSAA